MKPISPIRFVLLVAIWFSTLLFLIDHWYHPIKFSISDGVIPEKIRGGAQDE